MKSWQLCATTLLVAAALASCDTKTEGGATSSATGSASAGPSAALSAGSSAGPSAAPSSVATGSGSLEHVVKGALPFTISFQKVDSPAAKRLPAIQSFEVAITNDGTWLISGGRTQGLHTFETPPTNNFPPKKANHFLWVIHPDEGVKGRFDVNLLDASLRYPLQSTNRQSFYDRGKDELYLSGGYGENEKGDMVTFRTLMRMKVGDVIAIITSAQSDAEKVTALNAAIETSTDERFAVTGGELLWLGGTFYQVFGQKFDGKYSAFGPGQDPDYVQVYTEQIDAFTLRPGTVEVLSFDSKNGKNVGGHPYHRRDGNVVAGIDPGTGEQRISAFGGVFPPGKIGAYDEPIHFASLAKVTVETDVHQRFSQYECPVIAVYSATTKTTAHTFFGGISGYYFWQTPEQRKVYLEVTKQGRNDALPFIADVTTMVEKAGANGSEHAEWIHVDPIPGNALNGSSTKFLPNPKLSESQATSEGIVKLDGIEAGATVVAGYIFGGINSDYPLPVAPNQGTQATNALYRVAVTNEASDAIPGKYGRDALKEANPEELPDGRK